MSQFEMVAVTLLFLHCFALQSFTRVTLCVFVMSRDRQNDYRSPLSPSERNLFSIYVQYPDLTFENDEDSDCLTATTSSSDPTEADSRFNRLPSELSMVDVSKYQQLLRDYDKILPAETITYYTRLGHNVTTLGQQRPDNLTDHRAIVQWLTKCVTYSSDAADEQSRRIRHIKQLAAFNCTPSDKHLWSNLRQRTRIITSGLSLPTMEEIRLVEALVNVFDQCVCLHELRSTEDNGYSQYRFATPQVVMTDLQKLMHTWLHNLWRWCRGMRDLRVNYMQPIYNALHSNPRAMAELQDFQRQCARVAEMTDKRTRNSTEKCGPAGTKSESKSNASQPGIETVRLKTRYKREHTI